MRNKYTLNEDYFDKIDTPDKAYILGFLYADGSIYKGKYNQVGLELSEVDEEILIKIKNALNSGAPLRKRYHDKSVGYKNQKPSVRFVLCRNKICSDLENLGLHPRKTFSLSLPTDKQLPRQFFKDFFRGYFDGDGCITNYYQGNHLKWKISLIGNPEFIEELREELKNHDIELNIYKINKLSHPMYELYCGGNQKCKRILDWMYLDANLFLERKYQKYLKLSQYVIDHHR